MIGESKLLLCLGALITSGIAAAWAAPRPVQPDWGQFITNAVLENGSVATSNADSLMLRVVGYGGDSTQHLQAIVPKKIGGRPVVLLTTGKLLARSESQEFEYYLARCLLEWKKCGVEVTKQTLRPHQPEPAGYFHDNMLSFCGTTAAPSHFWNGKAWTKR